MSYEGEVDGKKKLDEQPANRIGAEFKDKQWQAKGLFTMEKKPHFNWEVTHALNNKSTFGLSADVNLEKPATATSFEFGHAMSHGSGITSGSLFKCATNDKKKVDVQSMNYFLHSKQGKSEVGAHLEYDVKEKKYQTSLGWLWNHADCSTKLRLYGCGLWKAALKWQLHNSTSAVITSGGNLKDFNNGKVSKIPVGLSLDIKL